jgi:regulator of sirC expression with transglutaminase-like and TPR domain
MAVGRVSVFFSAALLSLFFAGEGYATPQKAGQGSSVFSPEVRKILALPEKQIDIGIAALTFAKEVYPEIDIAAYSLKIDMLADQARRTVLRYGKYDPDSVIRALNTYYYRVHNVQYDKSPEGREKQENYFINAILDTKQGQCVTIPMLYTAIAQRLGYPVYPVMAPEHTFVRFVDPTLKEQNIELSGGAGYSSDEDYAFRLNISAKAIKKGAYLRTLTNRQYLGVLLQQNAIVWGNRGQIDKSIKYFEKAYEIDPKNVYFPKNLQHLWRRKAEKESSPELAMKYREKSYRYYEISEELGWTRDPDANTRGKK